MSKRRPPSIVCDRCGHAAKDWAVIGGDWVCADCIERADDHVRWCACGLMIAGSTRQILAMCEAHWRRCDTWALLTTDPADLCNMRRGVGNA